MGTASADPNDLFAYADGAEEGVAELRSAARALAEVVEGFNAADKELGHAVPNHGQQLQALLDRMEELDGFVRRVGGAFAEVDHRSELFLRTGVWPDAVVTADALIDRRVAFVSREQALAAAVEDAAALHRLVERYGGDLLDEGFLDAYPQLAAVLARIRDRAAADPVYGQALFVAHLGEDGLRQVLDTIAAYGQAKHQLLLAGQDHPLTALNLHRDLVVPLGRAFGQLSEPDSCHVLADRLLDVQSPIQQRQLAMLLSAGGHNPDWTARAASQLLTADPMFNFLIGPEGWGSSQLLGNRFGSYEIVAVTALANDRDASFAFLTASPANVDALIWPAGRLDATGWDGASELEVFAERAGRVMERGLQELPHLPGATQAQRQAAAQVWDGIVERVGERGRVPDELKRQLAGLAAMRMVVDGFGDQIADTKVDDSYQEKVRAFFKELSHDDQAAALLMLGGLDYLQAVIARDAARYFPTLDPTQASASEFMAVLNMAESDARAVLVAIGSGLDDARVSDQAQHAALFGAINFIGDTAVGLGVAASPLSGGTSALVGLTLRGSVSTVSGWLEGGTRPGRADDLQGFRSNTAEPMQSIILRTLFVEEGSRASIARAHGIDPDTVTFEEFVELPLAQGLAVGFVDQAEGGVVRELLWGDLLRRSN